MHRKTKTRCLYSKILTRVALCALAMLWLATTSYGAATKGGAELLLQDQSSRVSSAPYAQIFEDPTGLLTVEEAIRKYNAGEFKSTNGKSSFGYSNAQYWTAVRIKNLSHQPCKKQILPFLLNYPKIQRL